MSLRDVLMQTPVKERYEVIRQAFNANGRDISKTAQFLGIAYNTVNKAILNEKPKTRIYETKIKKEHILFIYTETIRNPTISGDEVAKKNL